MVGEAGKDKILVVVVKCYSELTHRTFLPHGSTDGEELHRHHVAHCYRLVIHMYLHCVSHTGSRELILRRIVAICFIVRIEIVTILAYVFL